MSAGLPGDWRSQYDQLRTVECTSDDSLPPFSVGEILETTLPEETEAETPDGGRIVHKIGPATADNVTHVIALGPVAIGSGGNQGLDPSAPGTDANLFYALVDSDVAIGDEVGLASGSTRLAKGYTGFKVVGEYNSKFGGIARVMRIGGSGTTYKKLRGTLVQTTCNGNMSLENLVRMSSGWSLPSEPLTAVNLIAARARVGAVIYAEYCEDEQQWEVTQVEHVVIEEVEDIRLNSDVQSGSGSGQDTCDVEKKVRELSVMECADPNWRRAFSATKHDVIVDVFDDGECVNQTVQPIFVLCIDQDTVDEAVFCTSDCIDESGSG